MDPPDCAINYQQWHSLPFGVAPKELAQAELEVYFQGLGIKTSRYYCKLAGGYDYDPLYWTETDAEDVVRFRTLTGGGKTLLLPRSSRVTATTDDRLGIRAFNA